jgi:arsenite methyltransferase
VRPPSLPEEINATFYGCGCPVSPAWRGLGLSVLDLGSGSGRDAYVAAALVGARGRVVGVDMTDSQLAIARRHVDAWRAAESKGDECGSVGCAELDFRQVL